MEELKNQIVAKLGIDASQAQAAMDMVLNFIKGKLPESMHVTIENALQGEGASGILDQAKGLLGGFLK